MTTEFELIERLTKRLGTHEGVLVPAGDDAAVVRERGVSVTSVDSFVEGIHFRLAATALEDLGHKCIAASLSDIAAMGAEAGELYVALGLPSSLDEDGAQNLIDGAEALARSMGVAICGGDIVRSTELFISVTAVGHAASMQELTLRSTAAEGDLVGVTGELGGAGAGLEVLERKLARGDPEEFERLIERYRRPQPQLKPGRALAVAGISSMIDVSDGIASDAVRVSEASGVAIEIQLAALPLQEGVAEVAAATGRDARELAATAGEDYELLFSCAPELRGAVGAAASSAQFNVTWIGEVSRGAGVRLLDADGVPVSLRGWDHLAPSREG